MGYSLSVPCKSPKHRDRLAAFLNEHSRPFSVACGEASDIRVKHGLKTGADSVFLLIDSNDLLYDPTQFIQVGDDLSYGSGPSKVGFKFTSQGQYGTYMHAVLSWAALHSGRRRPLKRVSSSIGTGQSVRYITYDHEPIPVLTVEEMASWTPEEREYGEKHWAVDKFGMRLFTHMTHYTVYGNDEQGSAWFVSLCSQERALEQITRREMERLDALWTAEQRKS